MAKPDIMQPVCRCLSSMQGAVEVQAISQKCWKVSALPFKSVVFSSMLWPQCGRLS